MSDGERELTITALAAGGDGVGRDEQGRVTFVPATAPGDRVRVRITEARARMARGELVALLLPGPGRVVPPCRYFAERRCGGCQWQHLSPALQAQAKRDIAASALRRLIAGGMELLPVAAPVAPFGWRRRARLHWVRPAESERAVIGLFAPRSHRVEAIEQCAQLAPGLEALLPTLQRELAPGLLGRGEIELLLAGDGRVHVVVHGRCRERAAAALAASPLVAGVVASGRVHGAAAVELESELSGGADRFAQASLAGNQALLTAVNHALSPRAGARILELFAGQGNFTRLLAREAAEVVAVNVAPGSGGGERVSWRAGRAEEVTTELLRGGERFDWALLDPPRSGARELMAPLATLAPAGIVYVSCDAASLARDLEALVASGYRAERALVLDLMPQTAHLEIVATLTHG